MDIESLIDKVLNNKATKEEIEIVEKWKAETQANLSALKQMQSILKNSNDLSSYQDFDKDKAWKDVAASTLDQTVEFHEVKGSNRKMNKWISIAASLLFILSAIVFFTDSNSNQKEWITQSNIEELHLDDGSVVWLNTNSQLDLIEGIEINRELNLQGEAFFDVAHMDNKPFVVNIDGLKIKVLGTRFNVKSVGSAHQVFVEEGKVEISGISNPVILNAGEMVTINNDKLEVFKSGNREVSQWREGKLVYRHFPLKQALMDLGVKYNVKFTTDKVEMDDCYINTKFNDESISEVLNELNYIINLDYKIIDRNVDILYINCD